MTDMASVPVILVFTKFDEVVTQLLSNTASGDAQHYGHAQAWAHTMLEDSCRCLLCKDPRAVPAEIVSDKARFSDLINHLVATTDSLITDSRAPSAGSSRHEAMPQGAVPDISLTCIIYPTLRVGRSRYWRNLWSNLDFADQTLKNCVNIIHDNIVEISDLLAWPVGHKPAKASRQKLCWTWVAVVAQHGPQHRLQFWGAAPMAPSKGFILLGRAPQLTAQAASHHFFCQ
ncbi:hypothetical protein EI94DRAFT_1703199 [Lactarius quietus]|nr:hypothetical protein EI94DRAFT_1703199 [Lactarius quietus]